MPIYEFAWRSLEGGDLLIALVRASEGEMKSSLGATVRSSTDFALSAERTFLVTLSELGDREAERARSAERVSRRRVAPRHLFFEEDGRGEAEARTADVFGEGDEAEPELVGGLPDRLGEAPFALEITEFRA